MQPKTLRRFRAAMLASAAGLALTVANTGPAAAFEFDYGEITGSFDTTIAAGVTVRTEDQDADLIGIANGAAAGTGGTLESPNGDNGNLNYDKGIVAASVRATHELEVNYENLGAFTRFNYFYDFNNANGETEFIDLSNAAIERVGHDFDLLDAYVFGDFEVGEHPVYGAVGNQVLSWGESTFIQNGINVINPIDVSAIRVPGSEIRDALVPVPMARADVGVTDNLSIEGFYQFQWEETEPDAPGTFFSTNDFVGNGGPYVLLGFGAISDLAAPTLLALDPASLALATGSSTGVVVPVTRDNADDQGQFGLAARYFAEELNQTEFGLYFINHHSRLPLASGRAGSAAQLLGLDPSVPNYAAGSRAVIEYPEDIQLLGASFSTEIGNTGIALQGEYSFRKDQPLQIDDVDVLIATLSPAVLAGAGCTSPATSLGPTCQGAIAVLNTNPIFASKGLVTGGDAVGTAVAAGALFEDDFQGWEEFDVSQAQFTMTKVFGPSFGSDQLVLVGEAAGTYIHGMPSGSEYYLEAPGTGLGGNGAYAALGLIPGTEPGNNFGDAFSWGYRVRGRLDFNSAIGPINVLPNFGYSHDVSGNTPTPLGNFVEDRMAATIGVDFENLEALIGTPWDNDALTANIQYTNYFSGGESNQLKDRDFLSFNLRYSF